MNKEQYKQLENKIKEEVPEIMELKFGCKMYYKNAEKNLLVENGEYIIVDNDDGFINAICEEAGSFHCGTFDSTEKSFKDIKVIGRDITLEDVLVAIKKEMEKDGMGYSDGYGCIMDLCYREQYNSWIPNKPLSEQREETLTFLYNLLCKN